MAGVVIYKNSNKVIQKTQQSFQGNSKITGKNNVKETNIAEAANVAKKAQTTPETLLEKIEEQDLSKANSSLNSIPPKAQAEFEKQHITDEILPQAQKSSAEQKVQEILGKSYYNPMAGETFNLAVSGDTESVDFIVQDKKDGIFKKHTLIIDKDQDIKKTVSGLKLYSEYDEFYPLLRIRQYTPNHELPKGRDYHEWYESIACLYEDEVKKFPDIEAFIEQKSNPKTYRARQLRKLSQINPTKSEHFLYRGINPDAMPKEYMDMLENSKIGDIIIPDWGVSCTTPDILYAINHYTYKTASDSPSVLRIKVPKGARLAGLHKDGFEEFHMPSMSEYKYLNKHNLGGLTVYDLEYIIPDVK